MARRILAAIAGALREQPAELVHFHQGPEQHPAPCYDAGCTSPRLSIS
jgi:hypothetical protein